MSCFWLLVGRKHDPDVPKRLEHLALAVHPLSPSVVLEALPNGTPALRTLTLTLLTIPDVVVAAGWPRALQWCDAIHPDNGSRVRLFSSPPSSSVTAYRT